MRRRLISLIVLLFTLPLAGQEKTVTAIGRANIVNGDVDGAYNLALERAKESAIEKTFGYEVSSLRVLSQGDEESYQHLVSYQNYATVSILSKHSVVLNNIVTVEIAARVIKDIKDSFLLVEGIGQTYKRNEYVNFTVAAYKNGYFYVFYLSGDDGELLFPRSYGSYCNDNYKLYNGTALSMSLYRDKCPETKTSKILFILLNNPHPFKGQVNEKTVLKWFNSLPNESKNGCEWRLVKNDEEKLRYTNQQERLRVLSNSEAAQFFN